MSTKKQSAKKTESKPTMGEEIGYTACYSIEVSDKELKELFDNRSPIEVVCKLLGIVAAAEREKGKCIAAKKSAVVRKDKKCSCKEAPQREATLSEAEQKKARALRKRGLSIKAIGKELHRNEKVVAAFVRCCLPKSK